MRVIFFKNAWNIIKNYIGNSYRGIKVDYVYNDKYAESGHSLSLLNGSKILDSSSNQVYIVHADGLFSPVAPPPPPEVTDLTTPEVIDLTGGGKIRPHIVRPYFAMWLDY